jgi:hypothetical protein
VGVEPTFTPLTVNPEMVPSAVFSAVMIWPTVDVCCARTGTMNSPPNAP